MLCVGMSACTTLQSTGPTEFFANHPDGPARIKITRGIGGGSISVWTGNEWSPPRPMEKIPMSEPPFSTNPGLKDLLVAAYRIDGFVFYEFKPDAIVRGQKLPSRYMLDPGGFAYKTKNPPPKVTEIP